MERFALTVEKDMIDESEKEKKLSKLDKYFIGIIIVIIAIVLVSIWWMNTSYVYDKKEDCNGSFEDKPFCRVSYKDDGKWTTIIEETDKEECKILEKEVENQTNRWGIDSSRLIFNDNIYSCAEQRCKTIYKKEIELTCENVGNKINFSTVTTILNNCTKNTLNVNLTSYNNTFSVTASCIVTNCEVRNLGCI